MSTSTDEIELVLAGRSVHQVRDRLRRYCGLPWSGGGPETWAYRYYDLIETDPDCFDPTDVVAAAALHPGLSRADLTYFWDHRADLDQWLSTTPPDVELTHADEDVISHLNRLASWSGAPALTLMTKVLHRKRPGLIPLVDRHVLDWYRSVTRERRAAAAWTQLLKALRDDLQGNTQQLHLLGEELARESGHAPSALRLVDIALWMGGRQ